MESDDIILSQPSSGAESLCLGWKSALVNFFAQGTPVRSSNTTHMQKRLSKRGTGAGASGSNCIEGAPSLVSQNH